MHLRQLFKLSALERNQLNNFILPDCQDRLQKLSIPD